MPPVFRFSEQLKRIVHAVLLSWLRCLPQPAFAHKQEGGLAMEGKQFRELVEKVKANKNYVESKAFKNIVDKLQVLARSSPEDKQTLAELLQGIILRDVAGL